MKEYFVDLHIHIGWTEAKEPIKISSSKNMTLYNILCEAQLRKGLNMVGIIDAHSLLVQREINQYIKDGLIEELEDGGLKYKDLTIILGSEVEIREENRGPAHFLVFFPYLSDIVEFSNWLSKNMRNINLSSQRLYVSVNELQLKVKELNGLFVPAHIFTPFKSLYGSCCNQMSEFLDISLVDAVELGLSSDTNMADRINELHSISFLSNSDAHSLNKIGREYNKILMEKPSFSELRMALHNKNGRRIATNYGLNPKLGKYYLSRCKDCDSTIETDKCNNCDSAKIIKGVSSRIDELSDSKQPLHPNTRPPYIHQIPLEYLPNLGPKTLDKLLSFFGSEMNILHKATEKELLKVVTPELCKLILKGREGELSIEKGGGGIYGKVLE